MMRLFQKADHALRPPPAPSPAPPPIGRRRCPGASLAAAADEEENEAGGDSGRCRDEPEWRKKENGRERPIWSSKSQVFPKTRFDNLQDISLALARARPDPLVRMQRWEQNEFNKRGICGGGAPSE